MHGWVYFVHYVKFSNPPKKKNVYYIPFLADSGFDGPEFSFRVSIFDEDHPSCFFVIDHGLYNTDMNNSRSCTVEFHQVRNSLFVYRDLSNFDHNRVPSILCVPLNHGRRDRNHINDLRNVRVHLQDIYGFAHPQDHRPDDLGAPQSLKQFVGDVG